MLFTSVMFATIARAFVRWLANFTLTLLDRRGFKEKIIDAVNLNVNIPMIDEKTEAEVFDALYDAIRNAIAAAADAPPAPPGTTETTPLKSQQATETELPTAALDHPPDRAV